LVVEVAAAVTPCRHDTGPTVLDEHSQTRARRSAASLGGDVVGTHQIPVPLEPAVRTAEPTALGLGDPPSAGRAGGGSSTLVHQPHQDSCPLGLVPQCLEQVGAAPPPHAEVLHSTGIPVGDALRIAHHQGAHLVLEGKGNDFLGGLVLGLVDTAAVAGLDPPHASPVAAPTPRPGLSPGWRSPGGLGLTGLLVA
jgi:hypothetical protein